MSLYEQLLKAKCELDHHESDLYVKDTPEARIILKTYKHQGNISTFKNQNDGLMWLDVPFEYTPFWRAKEQFIDQYFHTKAEGK